MVGVLEDHVDHPGDRIGAVTGRSAVAQHLDMVHRRQRDSIQVCRGRTAPNRTAQVDEGTGMSTLAVDQYQHLVRRQTAQLRRTHQFGPVHQAWPGEVDRRYQPRQYGTQLIGAGTAQVFTGDYVDWRQRCTGGALLGAGAGDDHSVEFRCINRRSFVCQNWIESHNGQQIGRQNRRV